jgi:hypothetical protein
MLVRLRKVVLQQVIHEVLFCFKVRWRKIHTIDVCIRRIRVDWLEAFRLIPNSGAW